MNTKVAIVGYGWVGKSMHKLFPHAVIYDPFLFPEHDDSVKEKVNACGTAFICVPTPCPDKSRLDVSTVEEVISWLKTDLIVIRSTVNPYDCDFFTQKYGKNICMQPEYLGETPQHPLIDTAKTPFLVIGGSKDNRRKLIELYTTVYGANVRIRQLSNLGAEVVKLSENRAIACKVAEVQELYDVCESHGLDYYAIREVVYGDDPRFNLWWTMIYPGKRGFNSKCIPKDVHAWVAFAEMYQYDPKITKAILAKNEEWIAPPVENTTT